MSQAKTTITAGLIEAENGERFSDEVYHETSRATGSQQWVADQWADGALPIHSVSGKTVKLYTGTRNFEGFQYPDGHGKLKHYNHIQAIRTRSGLVIGDSSCYGRGWAHCSYPNDRDHYIDLTESGLKDEMRGKSIDLYDIVDVFGDNAVFDDGSVYDTEESRWVENKAERTASVLGR